MNKDYDLIHLHDRCSLLEFIENEEYKLKSSSLRIKKLRAVYELKPLPQIVQKVKPDYDIETSYTSTNNIDDDDDTDITTNYVNDVNNANDANNENDVNNVNNVNNENDANDNILLPIKKPNVLKRLYSSYKKYSIKKNIQKSEEYHEYLIYDEDFDNCYYYKPNKNMWYDSLFK
jgi:hypothetical protein